MQLPFEPMLLTRRDRPFTDPGWLYQLKLDGVRNLALVADGGVRHWSRRGRERSSQFPEFTGLCQTLGGRRAVLDGELVVMRNNKPSFPAILERDLAGSLPNARALERLPAIYFIFDLLEYGELELYRRPLTERLELLATLVSPTPAWQIVESLPNTAGPALFEAVVAAGLEGVVAKRVASPYLVGTRTKDWVKIKRRQRMLAVVVGYTNPVGRPGALLLGAYRAGRLHYIGRAGSGLTGEQLTLIKAHLPPGLCPISPLPKLTDRFGGAPGPITWLEPRLTIYVTFTEWTEDLRLRDPAVVGFATVPPEEAELI
jgi:bifunctional non-homologous end joining protein LigD